MGVYMSGFMAMGMWRRDELMLLFALKCCYNTYLAENFVSLTDITKKLSENNMSFFSDRSYEIRSSLDKLVDHQLLERKPSSELIKTQNNYDSWKNEMYYKITKGAKNIVFPENIRSQKNAT